MQNTYAENIAANEAQAQMNKNILGISDFTSKIKSGIKSIPEKTTGALFGKHFDNTENLREAVRNKLITEDQYKRMSGYDATEQIPALQSMFRANPGQEQLKNMLASGLYNAYKSYRHWKDPTDKDAMYSKDFNPFQSVLANVQGSIGLPTDDLALYNQIISGQTSAPATQSTSARENYAQYKARMLEDLRKSHAGQEYAMTDLTPTGGYSGTSRELPIETYFNYMLADPWAHGFNPQTGIQFGTDDQGQFTNQSQFKQEMADYRTANPDYPYSHPLAKGGLAQVLGV
jgi:hypothetical protein